jgi:hypothetical protein
LNRLSERKGEKKKMNKTKTKISIAIAMILTLTMVASSIVEVLPVNAQSVQNMPSFYYVSAAPNPVGVGQNVIIVTWPAEIPPTTPSDYLLGAPGNRQAWKGSTLDITSPDGTTETIALPVSDPVGGNFHSYTPTMVGNYTIIAHFPAQWKNTTTYNRLYAAADSEPFTFVVQEQPLTLLSGVPAPTDYWTRPIASYNREWSMIGGNWLMDGFGNPYTTAPDTAHIVWTKPLQLGGIIGRPYGDLSYYEGTSYEQRFSYPIIISGILIYTQPLNHKDFHSRDLVTTTGQSLVAVDLRTGNEVWRKDNVGITSASIYEYYSPNQHGAQGYLWYEYGGNMTAYDPFTGNYLFTIYNVPSGDATVGSKGEKLIYVVGGPTTNRTWLAKWDFTYILSMTTLPQSQWAQFLADPDSFVENTNYWQWRPVTALNSAVKLQHNGTYGYRWNVTLPQGLNGSPIFTFDDIVIGGSGYGSSGNSVYSETYSVWAVSAKDEDKGRLLWNIHPKGTVANETLQFEGTMVTKESVDAGVFVMRAKESRRWIGFDINTGKQLWVTESEPNWMMYSRGCAFYGNKLISAGYGGQVFAYDLATGKRLWTADIDNEGLESAYQRAPLSAPQVVDGKVYVYTQEHSFTNPYYRTWKMYAFDVETGERTWDIHGAYKAFAFADGYMATANLWDMQVYSFGKGPTSTTVTIQNDVITNGNAVLVKGTVMDISGGTTSSGISTRFPNGVPAISDNDMTPWMEYLYMQMPKPADITGVEVVLSVFDPNGNTYEVGKTITDANGMFKLEFVPQVPGEYTVIASFEGTHSYFASNGETALDVVDAKPTPTVQPAVALPPTEMYFAISTIAIIVAIAIVGILLLRKRP